MLLFSHTTTVQFNEEPENTTALEGTTATFNCSINNENSILLWYANNTDVSYSSIQERGIQIIESSRTFAQLAVSATQANNNTCVFCRAIQLMPFNAFTSAKACLVVEGKYAYSCYMCKHANIRTIIIEVQVSLVSLYKVIWAIFCLGSGTVCILVKIFQVIILIFHLSVHDDTNLDTTTTGETRTGTMQCIKLAVSMLTYGTSHEFTYTFIVLHV